MRRLATAAAAILVAAACMAVAPQAAPTFNGGRAYEDLRQIVAIGPRPAGSAGARQTREYISKQLSAIGVKVEEQAFEPQTPIGPIKMVNVRATIPGPGQGRLIIAGHYDTKLFREFPFVGANDGGSSTAFLIELARVLKARRNGITIELLFLDGEEAVRRDWADPDHTYGSRHYVEAAKKAGALKDIRALVLVDMIGDRDLVIKRESNSTKWLTDTIWAAAKRLKRPEFVDVSTPIEDDHIEFLEAGVEAVDIIDLEYWSRSGEMYWHTAQDTLDKVAAGSLEAVGQVLLAALPDIEKRLAGK
jgi:Zn-dependent M28 family amino/carboxypeptidase